MNKILLPCHNASLQGGINMLNDYEITKISDGKLLATVAEINNKC